MFTELNKTNSFVITIPKEYFGSKNDKDNMQRLAVEVFAIDDKGIFYFDVGWSECDSGHPTHYHSCKIVETKDGWDLIDFGKAEDSSRKGDVIGKLEVFNAARHPQFAGAAKLWQQYLQETGKKEELKAEAQLMYERMVINIRKRYKEKAMKGFSKSIQEALGNYVYGLVDPFTKKIFYVGKANSNNRAFDHLKSSNQENAKIKKINEIRVNGKEPIVEVLRYGLASPEAAFEVEASIIDAIGIENLTNVVRGHGIEKGRLTLDEIERLYGSEPVDVSQISGRYMLFFVNRTYTTSLSEIEIYDSTRQFWYKVAENKRKKDENGNLNYNIALSIFDSVVIRIYSIEEWFKAGLTFSTREYDKSADRWEFVGNLITNHQLLGKRLLKDGLPLKANQQGFGYIN